jgi:bifunctional UDP-N-acetylglucosamine pyrophosphorylase/glucosamine-1-phosphate N-acetyltransferase
MIPIGGVPLLARIINALPDVIDEIIIVIGYRGEVIRNYFGNKYEGRKMVYVDGSDLTGTAGALFKTKDLLGDERFLVLNGDDLFSKEDFLKLIALPRAWGVFEGVPNHNAYFHIEVDPGGMVRGFRRPTSEELAHGMRISTGAFVLDPSIFEQALVPLKENEFSLPHTVLEHAAAMPIMAVPMQSWRTITYPEDVRRLEEYLASSARSR